MATPKTVATANANGTLVQRNSSQQLILIHGVVTPSWIISRLKSGEIHIDLAYQRRYHKWQDYKFSSYIKGMFFGYSLKDQMIMLDVNHTHTEEKKTGNPDKFFIEYLENLINKGYRYVLIDGQHRSNTLIEFVEGRKIKWGKAEKTIFELDGIPHDLDKAFEHYGDSLKEFFEEQPISITMVLKASLPILKELFVKSNEGTPLTTIEKGMAGNAPYVIEGIGDICSTLVYDKIWNILKQVNINKRQHEELVAKLLKFELNREDIDIVSKSLENMFHTDRPGFMETRKSHIKLLKKNWRILYDSLYPLIRTLKNNAKYTKSSLINLYILISLLTDKRIHIEMDKVFGKNIRFSIKNNIAFGNWFIKSEAVRMDDEWAVDTKGDYILGDKMDKTGKMIKTKMHNQMGYFAATTRYSELDDIKLRMRYMLRDFKKSLDNGKLIGVVNKIDTRAVTHKMRKKVAVNSGYIIDGASVGYSTMMDGKEVHIDHITARSNEGKTEEENLVPMKAKDNLLKSNREV